MELRIFSAICRHNLRSFHGRYAVFSRRVRRFFMGGTLILHRWYGNVPDGYAVPSWRVRPYFMEGTPSRSSLPRPPSWEVRRFRGLGRVPATQNFHGRYAVFRKHGATGAHAGVGFMNGTSFRHSLGMKWARGDIAFLGDCTTSARPSQKCERGEGHGSYWYLYFRRYGKLTSRYIGKILPE